LAAGGGEGDDAFEGATFAIVVDDVDDKVTVEVEVVEEEEETMFGRKR